MSKGADFEGWERARVGAEKAVVVAKNIAEVEVLLCVACLFCAFMRILDSVFVRCLESLLWIARLFVNLWN